MGMSEHTRGIDRQLGNKASFVGNKSTQGDKIIIIVPKEYHDVVKKVKNPLKVTIEEILD